MSGVLPYAKVAPSVGLPNLLPQPALPRIAHYPPSAFTSGPEFTELAASAGLVLDDWQARDLGLGLGERDDGRWASFQVTEIVSRQNGKDGIGEALGLGWLFLTGEQLIGHSAHEYKTAMEAFRRLVSLITNTDDLRRKVKKIINTNGEEGIELLTGQRMRFLARSSGAGRGFSFDKMIWNEAYALTAQQVDAVLPTMSARPNPQLWLMSSPPLDVTKGEALFRARTAALAGAQGVTYLDYGADMTLDRLGPCEDPGCSHQAGRQEGCILDDRSLRAATNPAYPHRISDEAIDRERATMDPLGFARERLGVWPPDLSAGFQVITRKQWDAMADQYSGAESYEQVPATMKYWPDPSLPVSDPRFTIPPTRLVGRKVFAVATTPRGAGPVRSSIAVASFRYDKARHIELVMSGPGTSWVPMAFQQLKAKYPNAVFVIDPGAPEGAVVADVQALGIEVTTMTTRDVAQGFGMIYDAATSSGDQPVVHLGQAELELALRSAGTRQVGDGTSWDARNASADITPLVAVTKALWGLASKGSEAEPVAPWVVFA